MTKESNRYYQDYGALTHIKKCLKEGFCYTGNYSKFHQKNLGNKSKDLSPQKFTVFIQNHDMVGNRLLADRISSLVTENELYLSAGLVLLSPFIPLIFMGEEAGVHTPFLYFTNHANEKLNNAVYKGYCKDFKDFANKPSNPSLESSFNNSCLNIDSQIKKFEKRKLFKCYQYLIRLRKKFQALFVYSDFTKANINKIKYKNILCATRISNYTKLIMIFNFSAKLEQIPNPVYQKTLKVLFDSSKLEVFIKQKTIRKNQKISNMPLLTIEAKSFIVFLLDITSK